MSRIPYIIAVLLLSLSSCGKGTQNLHILTDKKEMASAIEAFVASTDNLNVTMRYVKTVDTTVIETEKPDLVIGDYLSSPDLINIWEGYSASDSAYPALGGPVDSKGRPLLTPLSFRLPLIMGKRESTNSLPDHAAISLEDLRKASEALTTPGNNGIPARVGFSPTWNPTTFVDLLLIRYPESLGIGLENLDEAILESVVEEARSWVKDAAGTPEADSAFNERYRYIPDEFLILEGRIGFARTDFETLALLPDSITDRLGFRYLTGPRHIPVSAVTAAGIPKTAGNPNGAQTFIDWIVKPENQTRLVERWERDGIDVFGFLGGLSALQSVNNTIIADRFPAIRGMIPENHYLNAQPYVPNRWFRIKTEVVAPWFEESIKSPNSKISLAERYRVWDLSSLDESN